MRGCQKVWTAEVPQEEARSFEAVNTFILSLGFFCLFFICLLLFLFLWNRMLAYNSLCKWASLALNLWLIFLSAPEESYTTMPSTHLCFKLIFLSEHTNWLISPWNAHMYVILHCYLSSLPPRPVWSYSSQIVLLSVCCLILLSRSLWALPSLSWSLFYSHDYRQTHTPEFWMLEKTRGTCLSESGLLCLT